MESAILLVEENVCKKVEKMEKIVKNEIENLKKQLPSSSKVRTYLSYSLTYSLIYSLTYSLIYSLTHLLTHLLTHSLTYLLTYSLTYAGTFFTPVEVIEWGKE